MTAVLVEHWARRYETPTASRRWATPGDLAQALDPTVRQTPALREVDQLCVDLANRPGTRGMVFMPPQEGKTERTSIAFVLWLLEHDHNLRVAVVSYGKTKSTEIGRAIRDKISEHPDQLSIRLRPDSKAAGRFNVAGWRGGVYSTSIGGSLTGFPVDVLIIDDPHKDLDEAISEAHRAKVWRWWQGTAVPRLSPQTIVVVIQTRWHEADLSGTLLSENPGPWRILSIPAVAEKGDDPLGRAIGEPMQSARGQRDWDGIRKDVGEYVWAAEYQQRPAPAAGGIFKREAWRWWRYGPTTTAGTMLDLDGVQWALNDCMRFMTVDLATSTKTSADFTVAAVWGIPPNGELVLLDMYRGRVGEGDHFDVAVRPLASKWLRRGEVVHVEASQHSTTLAYEAGRAGLALQPLVADRDKFTRALPAAKRVEQHRVFLPADADWTADWVSEHASFPNGAHDDQVDNSAYAARVQAAEWVPQESAAEVDARRAMQREAAASGAVDFMTVEY